MRRAWLVAFAAAFACLGAGVGNCQGYEVAAYPIANEGAAYLLVGQVNQLSLFHRAQGATANESGRVTWEVVVPTSVQVLPGIGGEPKIDTTADGRRLAKVDQAAAGADWAQVMVLLLPTDYLGAEARLEWRLTWQGGQTDWGSASVVCLPPVAASRPRRLICGAWPHNLVKAEGQSAVSVADFLASTGLNYVYTYSPQSVALLQQRGVQPVLEQAAIQGASVFGQQGSEHPEVTAKGERKGVCPQFILDSNGEAIAPIRDWVAQAAKEAGAASLDWEWGKWGEPGVDTCFCPVCIRKFAEREKIREPLLTPQLILDKYADKWVAFRNEQYVGMLRLLYQAAKEANPAGKLIYLPYTAETQDPAPHGWRLAPLGERGPAGERRYLVYADVPKKGDYLDIFAPMYYAHGGAAVRELLLRTEALRRATDVEIAHFIVGQGDIYESGLGTNAPQALKAMMLAAAAAGGGTVLYPATMGGLAWHSVAQATNAIAALESFFLDGQRSDTFYSFKGLPLKVVEVTTDAGKAYLNEPDFGKEAIVRGYSLAAPRAAVPPRQLVLVFNLSESNDLFYKLTLPAVMRGRYQLVDVANGILVGKSPDAPYLTEAELAEGVALRTAKGFGVSAYLIEPYSPGRAGQMVYTERVKEEYHARGSYTQLDGRTQRVGQLEARANVDREGRLLFTLDNGKQVLAVAPQEGGRIARWHVRGSNVVVPSSEVVQAADRYGGAAVDLFWVPAQGQWGGDETAAYQIDAWGVTKERAWVRLKRSLGHPALRGLRLEKEISVVPGKTEVQVKVKVANTTDQERQVSYWAHAVPLLRSPILEAGQPLRASEGLFFEVPQRGGVLRVRTDLHDAVFATAGAGFSASENEAWERNARLGEFDGDWVAVTRPDSRMSLKGSFDPGEVLQVYSWRDGTVTLEWMYRPVTLPPGASWETTYRLTFREG